MARDVSISVPPKSASSERDTNKRIYELEDWFVEQLLGVVPFLGEDEFWIGTDEEVTTAVGHANDQIYELIKGAEVISDIRINGCIIQKKTGDTWSDVGSLLSGISASASTLSAGSEASAEVDECEVVFGIPEGATGDQGIQGIQGIQGETGETGQTGIVNAGDALTNLFKLPEADESDRACYAAWIMAESWTDTLQDWIELIDEESTLVATAILWAVDWIPWAGDVAQDAEDLQDKIEQLLAVNARDIEVIEYVACKLYCLFKGDPDLSDLTLTSFFDPLGAVQDYINSYLLEFSKIILGNAALALMGGWVLAVHGKDYFRNSFGQTAQYAQYFDNRDCTMCDDCPDEFSHTFNFNMEGALGWVATNVSPYGDLGTISANGWDSFNGSQSGTPEQKFCMVDLTIEFDSRFINTVRVYANIGEGNGNSTDQYQIQLQPPMDDVGGLTIPYGSSGLYQDIEVGEDTDTLHLTIYIGKNSPANSPFGYDFAVPVIQVFGLGVDPFV